MENLGLNHIYFKENLEIVSGNKEFYIFTDADDHRYALVDELVNPSEKEQFLDFLKFSKETDDFGLFHFRTTAGIYKPYVVNFTDGPEDNLTTLNLLDFADALALFKRTSLENKIHISALSVSDEYIFTYRNSTRTFKLYQFYNGKKNKLLVDTIEGFRKNALRNGLVLGKNIPLFKKFLASLENLEETVSAKFESSIRSNGMFFENVVFTGILLKERDDTLVVGRVVSSDKIEQLEKTNSLIEELKFDSLTKIYNKRAITEYAIKRFGVSKGEKIALIIVDLDHFKPVNDVYGHLAGDKVLAKTGAILHGIAGEDNAVGRYGGDEFMMIVGGMDDELVIRGTLHSILVQVRTAFENSFDDIKITASVGCAILNKDGKTYEELFKKADFCLYRAKDKGRNRYVFFRDDLHGELYKKASEVKTDGIKYDDREVKELEYMSNFISDLGVSPVNAIKSVLEHMKSTYNLDDIALYYGKEMKLAYSIGEISESQSEATYVFSPGFQAALDGKKFVRIDFPEDLKVEYGEFLQEMNRREIKSTIQCVLYAGDTIKGLVTFDRRKAPARWAEYEKNCAILFSSSINLLPDSTKNDFIIYSKENG